VHNLQQQRRLADARVSAHEDGRAGDDATPEDPVHLPDARFHAGLFVGLDGIDGAWLPVEPELGGQA